MDIKGLSEDKAWDYENGYYWFSPYNRMAKQIAHWELYKRILGLPGHVVELGVYKGSSLIRWCTFREMLENAHARKIVGFDAFGRFPVAEDATSDDETFIQRFETAGGDGLSVEELQHVLALKGFANVDLVAGDVIEQVPAYLAANPHLRIALLHLDMDVETPTAFALEALWDRVVEGGIVIIDDYNAVAGATNAVDAFCSARGITKIEKTPYYTVPSFIVKSTT